MVCTCWRWRSFSTLLLPLLLSEQLLQLRLAELLLGHLAGTNRLRGSEGRLLLLEGRLLLLAGSKLLLRLLLEELLLLGLLLLEELLLRSWLEGGLLRLLGELLLEVGGEGVDLAVLVLVAGEALQGDLLPGQLGHRHLLGLGGELLLLLRSKLLLRGELLRVPGKLLLLLGSKLLLLLRSKLLRVLGKLLILLELSIKLSLLLRSKLLLLRSKLLLLLEGRLLLARSKLLLRLLLSELLLLLEVPEVLVEVLGVELVRGGPVGVEVGGVEHRPPGALPAAGEGLPLGGGVVLGGDPLLLLNDGLLEGEDSLVPLLLQLESWVRLNTSRWNFQLL